jgi:hypothetical protein
MDTISAILSLFDDQDPLVVDSLTNRLGADPELLDRTWEMALTRSTPPAASLVNLILRSDAEALVDAFAECGEDLEGGIWLLPRLHLPRRDYRTAGALALDALAKRLPAQADGSTISAFLCHDCGFDGDRQDYDNPLNSFMPYVLERRIGLPMTLTALWVLIGRRLGLELEVIALPKHVLGRWKGGFIDLFEGGRMVTREELDARVGPFDHAGAAPYLAPASDRAILRRMARNLTGSYLRREDSIRATIAHGLATC